MLRALAISSLIAACAVTTANAGDVYRWVDDHGMVHYTDQWVPGAVVIKATKSHPASSDAGAVRRTADQKPAMADRATTQLSQESTTRAVKEDVAKVREQQCKEAKDRYEKVVIARRIYKPTRPDEKDEDRTGDRQYLSDEEADAYRVKARSEMQELCGQSAK